MYVLPNKLRNKVALVVYACVVGEKSSGDGNTGNIEKIERERKREKFINRVFNFSER